MKNGRRLIRGIDLSMKPVNLLFNGDLIYNPDNANEGKFKGDLENIRGPSPIIGFLQHKVGEMAFVRKYDDAFLSDKRGLVLYALKRVDNSPLWEGAYGGKLVGIGRVQCEIRDEDKDWQIRWDVKKGERIKLNGMDKLVKYLITKNREAGFLVKTDNLSGSRYKLTEEVLKFEREVDEASALARERRESKEALEEV